MSQAYDEHLRSEYWKTVSGAVKARAGYRCQLCNSQHDLAAHHRTYDHRGRELDHLDDLICLCRRCHEIFHGRRPEPVIVAAPIPPKLTKKQRKQERRNVLLKSVKSIPQDPKEIDAKMPANDGTIVLTRDLVNLTRTNGAFTNATMRALGFTENPVQGWTYRLVGQVIAAGDYRKALEGRFQYNTGRLAGTKNP